VDFLRIVRSLEELLYEVMTWLVFYPKTMWRIVVRPTGMMHYSDAEQGDTPDEQYTDTLSPPLFLMLTILIAHGVGLALGAKRPEGTTETAKALFGSDQNLLIFRSLFFSVFALMSATTVVRRRGRGLDRKTLRGPFYSQCYLTAPFALAISVSIALSITAMRGTGPAAAALALAGVAWYLWVETGWCRLELGVGPGRAFGIALWSFLRAVFVGAVVLALVAALVM